MLVMNRLVPEMIVSDLARSLRFYCEVLGFRIEYQRPEHHFAFLSFHGSQLMLEQDDLEESSWRVGPLEAPFGRGMNLSIKCPDVQGLVARFETAGHILRKPLEERWYRSNDVLFGERNCLLLDPDGYLLRFAEDLGTKAL
ncbi:bleomycin resistance protein [Pseudomonas sp. TWR2-1-1]|uniref:bleomycin resistance protein n=1 Tax=Pseudomonas sp. TWR2-1-1 TaxID=2804610 RepID=UPI003CF89F3F